VRPTRVLLGLEHVKCLSLKQGAYRFKSSARHIGQGDRQDRRSQFTSEPGNGMKQERASIVLFPTTAGNNTFVVLILLLLHSADLSFQCHRHASLEPHTGQSEIPCKPRKTGLPTDPIFHRARPLSTWKITTSTILLTYLCTRLLVSAWPCRPTSGTSRFNVSVKSPTGLLMSETSTRDTTATSLLIPNWSIAIVFDGHRTLSHECPVP